MSFSYFGSWSFKYVLELAHVSAHTVGMTLNSAMDPKAGSPTIIFANRTGGLDMENKVFTMYG
jgi:hypothetical protein